jgi:hypothetical protein
LIKLPVIVYYINFSGGVVNKLIFFILVITIFVSYSISDSINLSDLCFGQYKTLYEAIQKIYRINKYIPASLRDKLDVIKEKNKYLCVLALNSDIKTSKKIKTDLAIENTYIIKSIKQNGYSTVINDSIVQKIIRTQMIVYETDTNKFIQIPISFLTLLYDTAFVNIIKNKKIVPFSQKDIDNYNKNQKIIKRVKKWEKLISSASKKYDVDKNLISSIIAQESAGYSSDTSHEGAHCLMQIMPSTAKEIGIKNIDDPRENILGGTKYLKSLLNQFNNNERLALASYNAGPNCVLKYNDVPPYKETRKYITNVTFFKKMFEIGDYYDKEENQAECILVCLK